ncbi:MAG: prepilin-type N-terminal cleavage/methylation domain-containing protein, partial [Candidatus Fermentibacteraceae bacterium]|nr:prepilin-type N-terminal cleavage/methylation domain-containing protein [Candidatus Fermentibacteraceae bacterium]
MKKGFTLVELVVASVV